MQRIVPLILIVLVALGVLSSTLFVVDQRQFAVVYALGEIKRVIEDPGRPCEGSRPPSHTDKSGA